jgi:hypothetical protein
MAVCIEALKSMCRAPTRKCRLAHAYRILRRRKSCRFWTDTTFRFAAGADCGEHRAEDCFRCIADLPPNDFRDRRRLHLAR